MQIFVLDYNPKLAAQFLCDCHVIKQTLESAQLLCAYLHKRGIETPYKPTHQNHPCALWLNKSLINRTWLFEHFKALLSEYKLRYNKTHKCSELLNLFHINFYVEDSIEQLEAYTLNFCLCVPDEFKTDDPVQSYRNYYTFKYTSNPRLRKYTNRVVPTWLIDAVPSLIEY